MGNRLSKIYTRTGDEGDTGLGDGSRVAKENLRVEAYGTVDETNSAVGVVLGVSLPPEIRRCLTEIQHDLFDLGGELCIPGHVMISAAHVARLEQELDAFNDTANNVYRHWKENRPAPQNGSPRSSDHVQTNNKGMGRGACGTAFAATGRVVTIRPLAAGDRDRC